VNLVVAKKEVGFSVDAMYESAASHYLDVLDETGRPLKTRDLVVSLCENHPNYDAVQIETLLKEPEWDAYLKTRRQRHLVERTAGKLLAAEMGSRLGVKALEVMQGRLDDSPGTINNKDLVEMAKLGMNLNASIDKDLSEITGDPKITMHLQNVLIGLPPERAAILMSEFGRAMASPKAKGEIIDGCSTEE
jgi:hypothetical protein